MKRLCKLAAIGACLMMASMQSRAEMPSIRLAGDGKSFETSEGKPFRPWGFNYDRDYKMRLLEEYWEKEWDTVESDFVEMKELGANVVRIHLSVAHFMLAADKPNQANLDRLTRLVKHCEKIGIYLDVTGLGAYRKESIPAWYSALGEKDRWAAQANFWRFVARACKGSPAVFFYDIQNEPFIMPHAIQDWLGGSLAGFYYGQAIVIDPAGRDRDEITRQWLRTMVQAIRQEDKQTLVSCGLLPNGLKTDADFCGVTPEAAAAELDFICVHLYPIGKNLQADVDRLKAFAACGKAVIIEEIFPIHCSTKQIGEFLDMSRAYHAGVIGFYWGQTPAELKPAKDLTSALVLEWLELFQTYPGQQK